MSTPGLPLLRLDDRLLHGQVLVAWAAALRPARIVLASDAVAADADLAAVYAALPQEDYALAVTTLAAAVAELEPGRRTLVVCAGPADARRLVELGAPLAAANLGGLHRGEGKRELLPYVWLGRRDVEDLRWLLGRGVQLEARDLPGNRGVRLEAAALVGLWADAEGGCAPPS